MVADQAELEPGYDRAAYYEGIKEDALLDGTPVFINGASVLNMEMGVNGPRETRQSYEEVNWLVSGLSKDEQRYFFRWRRAAPAFPAHLAATFFDAEGEPVAAIFDRPETGAMRREGLLVVFNRTVDDVRIHPTRRPKQGTHFLHLTTSHSTATANDRAKVPDVCVEMLPQGGYRVERLASSRPQQDRDAARDELTIGYWEMSKRDRVRYEVGKAALALKRAATEAISPAIRRARGMAPRIGALVAWGANVMLGPED